MLSNSRRNRSECNAKKKVKSRFLCLPAKQDFSAKFDYFGAWKDVATALKIAPSEAWGLSISEVYNLFDAKIESKQDNSLIINTIREGNGMPREKMRNLI